MKGILAESDQSLEEYTHELMGYNIIAEKSLMWAYRALSGGIDDPGRE